MRFSRLEEDPTVYYVLGVFFFNMQCQHRTKKGAAKNMENKRGAIWAGQCFWVKGKAVY